MPFSLRLQRACNREKRMAEFAGETFRTMLEPFSLEGLYPEVETENADGSFSKIHTIQPHQMLFHNRMSLSGKEAKFVCLSGGVGCLSGETIIAGRPIQDWVSDQKAPACLPTLFGQAVPEVPYLKGMAKLYRVRTQSGREVVVTRQHRFLTQSGWVPLSRLSVGDAIASDGKWHGDSERGKYKDSAGYCSEGFHQGDELPRPVEVAVQDKLQQLHKTVFGSSASLAYSPPYTEDFSRLSDSTLRVCVELFRHVLASCGASPGLLQTLSLIEPLIRQQGSGQSLPVLERPVEEMFRQFLCEFHRNEEHSLPLIAEYQVPQQQKTDYQEAGTVQESLHSHVSELPCLDYTSFWDRIQYIEYVRYDNFYDIGVPGPEHYSAQGIFHHNSGKSLCASVEMVRLMRMYPGIKIVCTSGYDYYFTEFVLPTFRKVLPDDSPHIKRIMIKTRTYIMQNGSSIRFTAYDDPEKIKGWDCHVIWIEEPSEIGDGNNDKARAIFTALMERLRCVNPAYPLRVYFTMNPRGHNWAWSLFIKNEPGIAPQPLGDKGRETVFGHTDKGEPKWYCEWEKVNNRGDVFYTIATGSIANSFIPTGYVATMLGANASNPAHVARMVEGRFTPMNMLVYDIPIYSERTHIIDYSKFLDYWDIDEIPPWWRVIVGIDCGGTRSPWAIEFYAQTESGHWVCFDEIYSLQQEGMMWNEVAEAILEKGAPFEQIEYWIDPISSQQKAGPTSQNIQEEFAKRGLHVKTPRGYNKMGGILRVQSMLKPDVLQPCPYVQDYKADEKGKEGQYEIGLSNIYYLSNVPHKRSNKNPLGHACPANIAEKTVYRWDSTKQRSPKESEEGLSPVVSEKLVDRDDHAQTAEMFCFLGIKPNEQRGRDGRPRRAPVDTAPGMYGRGGKFRKM